MYFLWFSRVLTCVSILRLAPEFRKHIRTKQTNQTRRQTDSNTHKTFRLYVRACVLSLWELFLSIGAELQQTHENGRHVHIRLPHRKPSANQIDRCAADGAVGGEFGTGRLQEEKRQCFTWERERECVINIHSADVLIRAVIRSVCRCFYWCQANVDPVKTSNIKYKNTHILYTSATPGKTFTDHLYFLLYLWETAGKLYAPPTYLTNQKTSQSETLSACQSFCMYSMACLNVCFIWIHWVSSLDVCPGVELHWGVCSHDCRPLLVNNNHTCCIHGNRQYTWEWGGKRSLHARPWQTHTHTKSVKHSHIWSAHVINVHVVSDWSSVY